MGANFCCQERPPRASLVICGVQQMHEPFGLGQLSRRRERKDSVFNVCGRSRFAILHILKKKLLSGQVLGHVVGMAHVKLNGLHCHFFTQWSLARAARCRELRPKRGLLFSISVNRNRVLCMRLTLGMRPFVSACNQVVYRV